MVRGNHESWTRAGPGFQLLLSPWPRASIAEPWADDAPPYALHFRDLTMTVADVANSGGSGDAVKQGEKYAEWIKSSLARNKASTENWLLIHKPLWVHVGCDSGTQYASCPPITSRGSSDPSIDAIRKLFTPPSSLTTVSLILSGDTHVFEMFGPDDNHVPVQLIAGMSGTKLESRKAFEPVPNGKQLTETLSGVRGKLWVERRFGYVVLQKEASGWTATLYGIDGSGNLRCELKSPVGMDACAALAKT